MNSTDYITVRIKKQTHKKLRLIAAHQEEAIVEAVDRMATEELQRIESTLEQRKSEKTERN